MKGKFDLGLAASLKELKSTRNLTMLALLVAINIVLGSFKLYVTPTDKIGFGFLTMAAAGNLFGPVPAMLCGIVQDILKWLIRSDGAYFPGFTVSAALGGLFAGITLYKKEATIFRAALERTTITVFINIFLNSFWKLVYFGSKHYLAYVLTAVIKGAALLPFEVIILYLFLSKVLSPIKKQFFQEKAFKTIPLSLKEQKLKND